MTMFGGSVLERYFTGIVTEVFDSHSSFLTDELDLWYHGGIEDIATHVAWKWSHLSTLLSMNNDSQV